MPFIKIWIHAVWATKNRQKLLTEDIRQTVFNHIKSNGMEKNILIDCLDGHMEHVHCLFRLRNDQTIGSVLQHLKGESSYWINKQKLTPSKFEWQDEYFAVSVSESGVEAVRKYINNQENHHRRKSFGEEYDEYMKKYGFRLVKEGG